MIKMLIKEICDMQDVSVRSLEIRTGLSKSQISRWRNNRAYPRLDELELIAKALHVRMQDLYESELK